MLRAIWRRIWRYKFVICSVVFGYLSMHYGANFYREQQNALTYKAKLEAVSALFKPSACAPCSRIEVPKCPTQIQPAAPRSAPVSRRENATRQEPDYNDALTEAAEAAEKAKVEALKEGEPPSGQSARINPAINRRDRNGRLKSLPPLAKSGGSGVRVIRIPDWVK